MDFVKIINPYTCSIITNVGVTNIVKGYVKITYKKGRLSLTGVIGPTHDGNCKGSCGQCLEKIREGEPTEKWTREMLDRLCEIRDAWHLNDMRPYCFHQKELGWDRLARKEVMLYNYTLCREAINKQRDAERAAIEALKNGTVFTPSDEQVRYANLPYSITTHEKLTGEMEELYKPRKPIYTGDKSASEIKTLGWLKPEEHPDGILCKPCPVCGYRYGSEWQKEEVPQEVLDWLIHLPDAETRSAWI